jgi:hypothetical protein
LQQYYAKELFHSNIRYRKQIIQDKNIILTFKKIIQDMNNMVSRLRLLSKQIIQKQKILFMFHEIRFMGHL